MKRLVVVKVSVKLVVVKKISKHFINYSNNE